MEINKSKNGCVGMLQVLGMDVRMGGREGRKEEENSVIEKKYRQKENRDLRSLTAPTGCSLNIVFFLKIL